jgi:CRISPR-associated endonuclease Cas2
MKASERKVAARILLEALGTGVIISSAVVAPGAATILAKLACERAKLSPAEAKNALRYARQKHWIDLAEAGDGHMELRLTEAGQKRVYRINLDQPLNGKRWDGAWRIVMFDVPESHKTGRDALRLTLKCLGFQQLQRSVWAGPWPCKKELMAIKQLYNLDPYIQLIETKYLEEEAIWRQRFRL